MEFTLKTQTIGGNINNKEHRHILSMPHEFDVPNETLLRKRGKLFITLNIKTSLKFNLNAAVTVFIENVQEDFYRLTDDTPLHAMEKALNRSYKNLLSFKNESEVLTLGSPETKTHIAFSTALIWNSVLYTSYIGTPAIYLMRGAGIRNLSTNATGGEIWTASSILSDNDVIIIGTEAFAEEFSAQDITTKFGGLASSITKSSRRDEIAAVLIKVESTARKVKTPIIEKLNASSIRNRISNNLWKIRNYLSDNQPLSDKFKIYQSKKTAPISSINAIISTSSQQVDIGTKIRPKRLTRVNKSRKKQKRIIMGLLMLLGFGYINIKLFFRSGGEMSKYDISPQVTHQGSATVKGTQTKTNIHPKFINLSDISDKLIPKGLVATRNNKLYLLSDKSLFQIDLDTKESKSIYTNIEHAQHLACDTESTSPDLLCFIFGEKTLHVVKPKIPGRAEKYVVDLENVIGIKPYGNNVYFLTNDNIYKLTLLTNKPVKWITDDSRMIGVPKDIAVDGNIYILASRNIYKYSQGRLDPTFKLKDNSYLLGPININVINDKLYVLDTQEGSDKIIVVYNKNTGDFIEKILLAGRTDYEPLTLNTITQDPNHDIIFRKGNYLYRANRK